MPLPIEIAEQWMAQAYELAVHAAKRDEVPVGAILIQNNQIVGAGGNARESTGRTVAHAEIMALENYSRLHGSWRFRAGSSLFVTTEPCLMCVGALLWARVENIYYGCSDPKNAGLERVSPLIHQGIYDHRFREIRGGILGDRCSKLMSGYFREKRKGAPRSGVVPGADSAS